MTVKTVETEDLGEYDLLTAARYAGASKQAPKAEDALVEQMQNAQNCAKCAKL